MAQSAHRLERGEEDDEVGGGGRTMGKNRAKSARDRCACLTPWMSEERRGGEILVRIGRTGPCRIESCPVLGGVVIQSCTVEPYGKICDL